MQNLFVKARRAKSLFVYKFSDLLLISLVQTSILVIQIQHCVYRFCKNSKTDIKFFSRVLVIFTQVLTFYLYVEGRSLFLNYQNRLNPEDIEMK